MYDVIAYRKDYAFYLHLICAIARNRIKWNEFMMVVPGTLALRVISSSGSTTELRDPDVHEDAMRKRLYNDLKTPQLVGINPLTAGFNLI